MDKLYLTEGVVVFNDSACSISGETPRRLFPAKKTVDHFMFLPARHHPQPHHLLFCQQKKHYIQYEGPKWLGRKVESRRPG